MTNKLEPGLRAAASRSSGLRLSGGGPLIGRWSVGGKISEENSCHTGNLDVRWVKQFYLVLHDSCHHASMDSHRHASLDGVRRFDHVGSVVHLRVVSKIHSPLGCESRRMICDLKRDVANV